MTRILALTSTILLAACATALKPNQVSVEFYTEPPQAFLFGSDGSAWGIAPQTRVWTFNSIEEAKRGGTYSVTAKWVSGAERTDNIRLSTSVQKGTYTLSRPIDAPGLDQDLEYVAYRRNQGNQDAALMIQSFQKGLEKGLENNKKKSVTCTHYPFGTTTTCTED